MKCCRTQLKLNGSATFTARSTINHQQFFVAKHRLALTRVIKSHKLTLDNLLNVGIKNITVRLLQSAGDVAIGNPERHMRKASHRYSMQQ